MHVVVFYERLDTDGGSEIGDVISTRSERMPPTVRDYIGRAAVIVERLAPPECRPPGLVKAILLFD